MKTLILITIVLLGLISCKKETPEPIQPTFCWECESYVTTIESLQCSPFVAHYELDTLCERTELEIKKISEGFIAVDSFFESGKYYTCYRIYSTGCKKLD